jgi:hypothetical protein
MDFVWIAAIAVFWVVMAQAVLGLGKLDAPKKKALWIRRPAGGGPVRLPCIRADLRRGILMNKALPQVGSLRVAAHPLTGGNTSGPAKPVPRCSLAKAFRCGGHFRE